MAVSNIVEKLGRAIFEAPFGTDKISKDAPELAEIRIMVIDAVKAKSHRASGKYVFPYNSVRISLLGVPEEQASVFRSEFLVSYFSEELRSALTRSSYRFPGDLRVAISTTSELPRPNEPWLSVAAELVEAKVDEPRIQSEPATLRVVNGVANHVELKLEKVRTNIGRTVEVFRAGGPSRQNDLAFAEDNEIGRSVSRQHAHVTFSKESGEYRLFNDRVYKNAEDCGLHIMRDGLSQAVHRSGRGTVLKPDDEIHLGQAILRFECG